MNQNGKNRLTFLFIFIFLIVVGNSLLAQSGKNLLVLLKESEGVTAQNNPFRWHLHQPLEKSGYKIKYFNIESHLPLPDEIKNINAILTWFNSSVLKNPEQYLNWLIKQIYQKRKIVILDNLGAYSPDGNTWLTNNALNQFFLPFGLEFNGNWTNNPESLEIVEYEKRFLSKDISIKNKKLDHYFWIKSNNANNLSYLVLKRKDIPESESHLIVQTPFGGFAMQNYVSEFHDGKQQFFLDIVPFVKACLKDPIQSEFLPAKHVLALLKRSEIQEASESLIHRFAFKPLLDSGYSTTYEFVEDGLPEPDEMQKYAAIITWFQTPDMLNGEKYVDWALEQIKAGRKMIIIGNLGCFKAVKNVISDEGEPVSINWWITWPELNNFLYPFGVEFLGGWIGDPNVLQIKHKESRIVEKDIQLDKTDLKHYYTWRSVHPENKIYLEVERNDQANSNSAFILRTPYGGMAFEGYLMKWDAQQNRLNFYLNIPEFFKECLNYTPASRPQPVPLITHREILDRELPKIVNSPAIDDAFKLDLPTGVKEIKRWILALYDSKDVKDLDENPIRKRVEIILNHLGMVVEHWDLQKGLPKSTQMEKYRGILTWFQDPIMENPENYAIWLQQQIQEGRKVVILGNYGAYYDAENELPVDGAKRVFKEMALRYWDLKISPGKKQKIIHKSKEMLDFETPVDLTRMTPFETKITSEDSANDVYLAVEDSKIGRIDAVVVTPHGGIALDEAPFKEGVKDEKWMANLEDVLNGKGDQEKAETDPVGQWRINPFLFFAEAFGITSNPIPDFTTLNGLRIYYSHIDGDGLTGISLIDLKTYSSEFVRDQILTQYPLPISASVITKEFEDKGLPYYNRPLSVARTIFELDNIEAATHSYTHPFNWQKGDITARPNGDTWDIEVMKIDYDMEIYGSVKFIENNLLPPHKKLNLYLWSGQCNPDERALSRIDNLGIKNMNWGDPIYDSHFPSYSCLAPLATKINGYWQFHTSGSNDFIYTKGWTRNFGNMAQLVEHFEYTESPRRILPINIYIHFYIGDRQAGLDGLKKAYNYCMNHSIAPIFTSEFVNIIQDFIHYKIFQLPDDGYRIVHDGALRTIRLDNCTQYPDLNRSKGIIGFYHHQNSLYIHLSEGTEQTIYLQAEFPREVYLKTGSHYLHNWHVTPDEGQFYIHGLGKAEFEIANLQPSVPYQLQIKKKEVDPKNSKIVVTETIRTNDEGILKFNAILKGYEGEYFITLKK
ncbi:hypothetical protein JW964_12035 [candidate division KSB1 bacterium]|nr:hypothetical protein [candidate division KSB1 bacterium]